MATIIIKHPDGSEHEHDVSTQLTVGRSEGNDLVLTEGGVSRKHARFFVDGGAMNVEDIGSANGTWVDGARVEAAVPLSPSSQVVIGDYQISVKANGARPTSGSRGAAKGPRPRPAEDSGGGGAPRSTKVVPRVSGQRPQAMAKRPRPPPASGGGPVLKVLSGGSQGKSFKVTGKVVVGRVAGVELQIEDDSISRRHAEVELTGRRAVLRDLGSANGTTLNAEPVTGDVELQNGDIIQFGVVEVMFESGTGSGGRGMVRRPMATGPSESLEDDELPPEPPSGQSAAGGDPRKKKLFIAGGGVVGLLFIVALVKAFTTPTVGPTQDGPIKAGPQRGPPPPVEVNIDELLARCRSYASADFGQPNWEKAEAACTTVLDAEPIHVEANELMRRIKVERECQVNLDKANELVAYGRHEESIEYFGKITDTCPTFFLKAMAAAKEPVREVQKIIGRDCANYARGGKWENALKACELYTRLACQTMKPSELYPPALTTLKLDGRLGPQDWRPKDTLYVNFLKARAKLMPNEIPYLCPEIKVLRPPPPPPPADKVAKDAFAKRYPESEMLKAVTLYFDGRLAEAVIPLQKIIERVDKASLHEESKDLLRDINLAGNLFETGLAELTNERPERAEPLFHKALSLDEKIVLGPQVNLPADEKRRELERRASFVRKTVIDSMSSNCYRRGKDLADRKDFRQACKMWKLGLSFSRASVDLLKAAQFCSAKAGGGFEKADSCEALKSVLDFAVDGDGYKENVAKQAAEWGCQ